MNTLISKMSLTYGGAGLVLVGGGAYLMCKKSTKQLLTFGLLGLAAGMAVAYFTTPTPVVAPAPAPVPAPAQSRCLGSPQ